MIVVEKVRVECRLDRSTEPAVPIHVCFGPVAIHPVHNIQGSVDAQEKYVMGGQVVDVLGPLEDHQLEDPGVGVGVGYWVWVTGCRSGCGLLGYWVWVWVTGCR